MVARDVAQFRQFREASGVAPGSASPYIFFTEGIPHMAMTVNIRKEFEEFIARLIESGRYNSEADVVDNALFYLEEREERREAKLAKLRAEIQKGFDSGPAEDVGDMFERIKSEGRRRLAVKDAAE